MKKMSKNKNWKKRDGVVFSTNPDYDYNYENESDEETLNPSAQKLRIYIDRKQRRGKEVTVVEGFVGEEEDLKDLGKKLKTTCGVGGSVKDGIILLQGDQRKKIGPFLEKLGFTHVKIQ